MIPFPYQQGCLDQTIPILLAGEQGPHCICGPTGSGKTFIMTKLIEWSSSMQWPSVLYTNRKMLLEQLANVLHDRNISHGVRASGWIESEDHLVQVSSLPTENTRVFKSNKWANLHPAKLVLIDEAHLNKEAVAQKAINIHLEQGAIVLLFTATPLGLGHICKNLIIAGTVSECRKVGALIPARTFAPNEPDMKGFKQNEKTGDYVENDVVKAIMTPAIIASVLEYYDKLNPDQRPSLLFAPGAPQAKWFAEQFEKRGIRAASITSKEVYFNGKSYTPDIEIRQELAERSKDGSIKVVCNRFILREGIDWPWLYHGIFATVFGSLQSFIQSGGRLLRNHPSLPGHVVIQDHGGNWWRHGSLNDDREWRLDYTPNMVRALREEAFREKKEAEPITCPKCKAVRRSGQTCNVCGHFSAKKSREVIQKNGSLKVMEGDIFKRHYVQCKPNTLDVWKKTYFRSRRAGMSFRQAEGLFVHENHYWPPRNLPLMPTDSMDWFRKVKDVPTDRLIQETRA